MNKFVFLFSVLFWSSMHAFAQTPIPLQYVVYNSSGDKLNNKLIEVKVSLLKSSFSGEEVYVETHTVRSDSKGTVTLKIGTGKVEKGTYSDDLSDKVCARIEQDVDNGGSFKTAFSVSFIKGILPEQKIERSLRYVYDSYTLLASELQIDDKYIYYPKEKETGANSPVNGEWNMKFIQSAGKSEGTAARYCMDYVSPDGKDNWFLPSIEELLAMCRNKEAIGDLKEDEYWSSTEDGKYAWRVNMQDCSKASFGKQNTYFIRCVRKDN